MAGLGRVFLLFSILALFFVAVGWVLGMYLFGDPIYSMAIFLVLAAVLNVVSYLWSDKIVLAAYRARLVDESQAPRLYRTVKHVSQMAGMPMPRVAVVPTSTPNAFATGRGPDHAVVAATEGLLDLLDDDELEGVIAHEMAHVQNRDVLVMSIAATIAGVIAFAARWALWSAMFGRRSDGNLLLLVLVAITAPIAAFMVQAAISRSREFRADETGARLLGKPWALVSALQRLERGNARNPLRIGNPASSHMFIVNPFKGGLAGLFSTHPPVEERVRRLNSL